MRKKNNIMKSIGYSGGKLPVCRTNGGNYADDAKDAHEI